MYPLPTQLQSHIFLDTPLTNLFSFLMVTSKTFHYISFFFLSSNQLLSLITHHCNNLSILFQSGSFFFPFYQPIFWIFYCCVFFSFISVVIKWSWCTRALWYHANILLFLSGAQMELTYYLSASWNL